MGAFPCPRPFILPDPASARNLTSIPLTTFSRGAPMSSEPDSLPPNVQEQIRSLCEHFQQAWEEGGRPRIEEYLPEIEEAYRAELRRQLLIIESRHRAAGLFSTPTEPYVPGPTTDEPIPVLEGYSFTGQVLGLGGMGVVWRGRDERLHRDVAVKVLRMGLKDQPAMLRRFQEETQLTSQLQHPGILPVHEAGTLPDSRPFFCMKVIKGRTLADLLEDRKSPVDDLPRFLQVFEQVCQAVGYAHSKGVIHRDLKPLNVMVGAFGEVQVMDWGLGKVLTAGEGPQEPEPPRPPLASVVETDRAGKPDSGTQAGSVLGTYAYMPPEQARGELGKVDRRSDVFGLGAILCEILTGHPPAHGFRRGAKGTGDSRGHGPSLRKTTGQWSGRGFGRPGGVLLAKGPGGQGNRVLIHLPIRTFSR